MKEMKKVIFYSPDFSMCYSLLMYLQDNYMVTTTTDIDVLNEIIDNAIFDLVILDAEPSKIVEEFCKKVNNSNSKAPLVLTYVYNNRAKALESNIRKYVNTIFYKPFDLAEVSMKLSSLAV